MGTADACQIMEEVGITIDRLEMRDIVLLDPECIRPMQAVAIKVEHKFVFGMGLADGEVEFTDI